MKAKVKDNVTGLMIELKGQTIEVEPYIGPWGDLVNRFVDRNGWQWDARYLDFDAA